MRMGSLDHLTDLLAATVDDLRQLSVQLDAAMQQAAVPAFELTADGRITYLNPAARALLGEEPMEGRRFTDLVGDPLFTGRRLESLGRDGRSQAWPERFVVGESPDRRCRLVGKALPAGPASDGPRLILWAEPEAPETDRSVPARRGELPPDRRVLGRDLDRLRRRVGVSVQRFCELLGISATTWYAWRRNGDEPVPNRTAELHLRLLDALPEVARPADHPTDLQQLMELRLGRLPAFTEIAIHLGVQRRTGYSWAQDGPVNGQARALTASLMRLLLEHPAEAWEDYRALIDLQARLEGIDVWRAKSWGASDDTDSDGSVEEDAGEPIDPSEA